VVLALEGLQQEEEKDKKQDLVIQFQLVLKEVKVERTSSYQNLDSKIKNSNSFFNR
jgi:hypothetical protein